MFYLIALRKSPAILDSKRIFKMSLRQVLGREDGPNTWTITYFKVNDNQDRRNPSFKA